ncbi:MAG: HAD-superfamily hydrolase, subfamily variant 3 [Bacteroidota bacterium]|nr:HAD-superfamily hydrolase, subfamily variant 3 [Bacteroidota bacterium]
MNKVQTIIFDLGGVIINVKQDKLWWEQDILPYFNREKLEELYLQNFFKFFEAGKITPAEFVRQLKEIAIDDTITNEKIIRHWNAQLKDIPEERVELLRSLKNNYQLILTSNTNDFHLKAIKKYTEEKFGEDILENIFHACYFSHEVGIRKPHKDFFDLIIKKQNLQPESCLYIDDKQENLVEPSTMGITTLLVDREVTELLADY